MNESTNHSHPWRHKMDGSLDALCLSCLKTISPASHDGEGRDVSHVCETFFSDRRSSSHQSAN
jgi:hypothetical protein